MTHSKEILSYIIVIRELEESGKCIKSNVQHTFYECFDVLIKHNLIHLDNIYFKINTVIDYLHDQFNTGHWSKVSLEVRRVFTTISFIKAYTFFLKNKECTFKQLKDVLKYVDLGLLLGAPLLENSELLLKTATYLTKQINKQIRDDDLDIRENKKRRCVKPEILENSKEVSMQSCPSIERFNNDFFIPQIPVKLTDCMKHWPAVKKWKDVTYLLSVAGERTVPIEIGSHYVDENWGQRLMTLRQFIKNHFFGKSKDIGYLAQHNLFDQISELRRDVLIPEYCCLSKNYDESCEPDINAWLGPEGTVSPLHYDPKDNILAQVFGSKQIILFSPDDSQYLYAHQNRMLSNTAQVNPLKPDLEIHSNFKKATMYQCILEPEEMLFIPSKWWHHVTALEKSFSVSFWWK